MAGLARCDVEASEGVEESIEHGGPFGGEERPRKRLRDRPSTVPTRFSHALDTRAEPPTRAVGFPPCRSLAFPLGNRVAAGDPVSMALLATLRYGLPAALIAAGFAMLVLVQDDIRWDGWAMCVGSGLSLLLLNGLFRLGARGDEERDAEQAARDYLGRHGHWPDED